MQQNLPPDNDKFYTEYDPETDMYKAEEDRDQNEKDKIVSQIAEADDKLE